MNKIKYIFIITLLSIACFFYNYNKIDNNQSIAKPTIKETLYVESNNGDSIDNVSIEDEYINNNINNNISYANKSYVFKNYQKYDSNLNIVINFVNYKNDTIHQFNSNEIHNIINNISKDLLPYFETITNNKLSINIDYVVSTAPKSYNEYLALNDAVFQDELAVFKNGIDNVKDEFDNRKELKFDTYNVRINCFAGSEGKWNTFLWPHAYSSNSLMLLMETKCNIGVISHELLHILGLEDLYAYTGSSQHYGVGPLDIMGNSDAYNSLNAYYKNKAGWLEESDYNDNITTGIETLSLDDLNGQDFSLAPAFYNGEETKTIAYKFGINNNNNGEYFMVEYRIKNYNNIYDPALSVDKAIVVYRVNVFAKGNSNVNDERGRAEVLFFGDLSKDISSYDYFNTCVMTSGSYGSSSMSNKCFVYSSTFGKENLLNGTIFPYKLTIKDLSPSAAIISFEKIETYTITPKIYGNGSLSISNKVEIDSKKDYKINIFPDEGYCIDYIKIDNEILDEKTTNEIFKKGYYIFSSITANHLIEIKFSKKSYNIIYNLDGGNLETNINSYFYGVGTTLEKPTKEDYIFLGWSLKENENEYITDISKYEYGDIELYANYKKAFYNIYTTSTINNNTTNDKIKVNANDNYTINFKYDKNKTLTSLKIDDYTYPLDELITIINNQKYSFNNITDDHYIEATYGILQFNITYLTDGGNLHDNINTYIYKEELTLPSATKNDYEFLGWSYQEQDTNYFNALDNNIYGDITLYAVFEYIDYEVKDNKLIYHSSVDILDASKYLKAALRNNYDINIIFDNGIEINLENQYINKILESKSKPWIIKTFVNKALEDTYGKEYDYIINSEDNDVWKEARITFHLHDLIIPQVFVRYNAFLSLVDANYSRDGYNLINLNNKGFRQYVVNIDNTLLILGLGLLLIILILVIYSIINNKHKKNKNKNI